MLKTVLNSALVTLKTANTAAAVTGNAAVVSALTTPEVTSQPKSTITAKIAAALARVTGDALVYVNHAAGFAVITADATTKSAIEGQLGSNYASGNPIASVIDGSVSSDGLRAKFILGDDAVDTGYNRPTSESNENVQQLVDAICPVRPMLAWDKAMAMFIGFAEANEGQGLAYNQSTGEFRSVNAVAKTEFLAALPSTPAASTIVFEFVEDADPTGNTVVPPKFGN